MLYFFWLTFLALPVFALDYAVMMDAGSTGTRVFVYQYELPHKKVQLLGTFAVEPGLSSVSLEEASIRSYLKPLLDFSRSKLPRKVKAAQVNLFLQATGGVRAMDERKSHLLVQKTEAFLKKSGFKNPTTEIISGLQEGEYQWLALNYLNGSLDNPKQSTVGLIEMGGASMQVTFLKKEPFKQAKNLDKQLYIKTYAEFGEHTAWERIGMQTCKKTPLSYEDCRLAVNNRLLTIQRPKLQGAFYLIDNFKQLATVLNLKTVSVAKLDDLGPSICQKTHAQLAQEHPKESPYYLSKVCFDIAYMSVVLERLGFERTAELLPVCEVNGMTLSWTLGALLSRLSSKKTALVP